MTSLQFAVEALTNGCRSDENTTISPEGCRAVVAELNRLRADIERLRVQNDDLRTTADFRLKQIGSMSLRLSDVVMQDTRELPSVTPSAVAPREERAGYFDRNLRTIELANTVARFLGLKPEDEIPFAELTRRMAALVSSGDGRDGDEILNAIHDYCRVVYYPKGGMYPVEHTLAAKKDSWGTLLHAMRRDGRLSSSPVSDAGTPTSNGEG